MRELITNTWWAAVLVVVAVFEYGLGKKKGRRIGYVEGLANGRADAFRELGVPVRVDDDTNRTVVVDVSRLASLRETFSKGRSS